MRDAELLGALYYQSVSLDELSHALRLPADQLFDKLSGRKEFVLEEIQGIRHLLGLTDAETEYIFFDE